MNRARLLSQVAGLMVGVLSSMTTAVSALAETGDLLEDDRSYSSLATGGRPVPFVRGRDSDRVVETLWEDRFDFVRIELAEPGASRNQHPAVYDSADIHAALAGLQLQRRDAKAESVFTEKGLERISPLIAQLLSRAKPDQDITFAVAGKKNGVLNVFARRRLTTGRIFQAEDALNIIIGIAHGEFEDKYQATGVLPDFTPGSRGARIETGWDIRTEAEDERYAASNRTDWVLVGPSAMYAARSPETTLAARPTTRPADQVAGEQAPKPVDYDRMERRLETAKRFLEKGLISKEEYDAKRTEILEDL